jgi:cytochrome c biogenesis protein ResB
VSLRDVAGQKTQDVLLSGDLNGLNNRRSVMVSAGGRSYAVSLARTEWPLPFQVTLNQAEAVYYPGTQTPKEFKSDIIAKKDGAEVSARIQMNEPLRRDGFILFQSNMGPALDRKTGQPMEGRMSSGFTVVTNPSDHWPTVACIASLIGLVIHFIIKLNDGMKRRHRQLVARSA